MDLTGQVIDNNLLSMITAEIGSVRKTMQDPASYNNENMGTWILMDGSSCAGSSYEAKFGTSVVPDAYSEGAFFRQAKSDRTLGTSEEDAFQGHFHGQVNNYRLAYTHTSGTLSGNDWYTIQNGNNITGPITDNVNGTPRTASETRPKNIAVNYMIKVNN